MPERGWIIIRKKKTNRNTFERRNAALCLRAAAPLECKCMLVLVNVRMRSFMFTPCYFYQCIQKMEKTEQDGG